MLEADFLLLLMVSLYIGSVTLAILLFLSDLWGLYFENLFIKITAGVMLVFLTVFYGVKRLLGAKNE